jgi:UDPglucose--hexose-1-phosphate uridylyltransferase
MSTQPRLVWEQRWHPLREEWVLYTSHRGGRPWIGDTHAPAEATPPRMIRHARSVPATSV